MTYLWVALGAAVGAPLRYLTDRFVSARIPNGAWGFPWGTLLVNVVGSFVLGALAGATSAPRDLVLLVGVGFCGALTTYSTFAYETVGLMRSRRLASGLGYAALTLVLGVAAAAAGFALARALSG